VSLSLGPRRIYPRSAPDDYWASPSLAGLPRRAGLLSGFCSSGPSFASLPSGRPLPSDSASRRTPLLRLAVPVITVRRGLAPPRYTTCLAHKRDRFKNLKRSLSIGHIMAGGDTCPQGDTCQKPVTETSFGDATSDIDHNIAQIYVEGKHASDAFSPASP
jgi:hypothetical protein